MYSPPEYIAELDRWLSGDALRIYQAYRSRLKPLIDEGTACRAYCWHDGSRGGYGVYRLDTWYKSIRNNKGEVISAKAGRITAAGRHNLERIINKLRKQGVLIDEYVNEFSTQLQKEA